MLVNESTLFYFIHCLLLLPFCRYSYLVDLLSRNALHLRVDHQKGLNIFGVPLHTRGPPERVYNISGDNLITMRGPTQEGHSHILGPSISNELGTTATLDPYLIIHFISHIYCVFACQLLVRLLVLCASVG